MPIQDFITGPYNALWALWESDAVWAEAVKPGNRIKMGGKSQADPRKLSKTGDGDYPQAVLELGNFSYQADPKSETFGTFASEFDTATSDWTVYWVQEYRITLTTRTIRIGESDPLLVRTAAALGKGYPALGLDYVYNIGKVSATMKDTDADEAKGTLRKVMTLTIPITLIFQGRDLVAV